VRDEKAPESRERGWTHRDRVIQPPEGTSSRSSRMGRETENMKEKSQAVLTSGRILKAIAATV